MASEHGSGEQTADRPAGSGQTERLSPPWQPTWPWWLAAIVVLAALVGFSFGQVREFEALSWEDGAYVFDNPNVLGGLSAQGFRALPTETVVANWHPLTMLTHMLDCQLFGTHSGGHHLMNVAWHLLNSCLMLLVLWRYTGNAWASLIVACLFAVHPLRAESVAWISGRKDLVSTCFWLLTMLAYLGYVRRPHWGRMTATSAFMALGLMSKQMLVTLPVVLMLCDYWPLRRYENSGPPANGQPPWRRCLTLALEKWPLWLLSLLFSLCAFYMQHTGGATSDLTLISPAWRIVNALVAYVAYLYSAVVSWQQAFFYPHPRIYVPDGTVPMQWIVWAAGSFGLLVLLSLLAWCMRHRYPYLIVGWLWFLITLLPVIGLLQVGGQARADRYSYVPLVGLLLIFGFGAVDLWQRRKLPEVLLGVLVMATIGTSALICRTQVGYWRNDGLLAQRALELTPLNYRAHSLLGSWYASQQRYDLAKAECIAALQLAPRDPIALAELGRLLLFEGEGAQAIDLLEQVLLQRPDDPASHNNLALAYAVQRNFEQAEQHYQRALEINPQYAKAYQNLGALRTLQQRYDEADRLLRQSLALVGEDHTIWQQLGKNHLAAGRAEQAIDAYRQALAIEPSAATLVNLANILTRRQEYAEAQQLYQRAIELDQENALAYFNLATMLLEQGGRAQDTTAPAKAIVPLRAAVARQPNFIAPYLLLAEMLLRDEQRSEAAAVLHLGLQRWPQDPRLLQLLEAAENPL